MKKPELNPDWRKSWRWFSMQAMALSTALLASWAVLPEKLQDAIPHPWPAVIAAGLLVLGMVGRLVKQEPKA